MDNNTPQPEVSDPQPVTEKPCCDKKSKVLLYLGLTFAFLLFIGLVAYTAYLLGKESKEDDIPVNEANNVQTETTVTSEVTSTTSSAVEDPYAGWETFTDTDNQNNLVSFKYPSDWTFKEGVLDPPCDPQVNPVFTFTSPTGNILHFTKYVCGISLSSYLCLFPESEKIITEAIEVTSYDEITTINGIILRRGPTESKVTYNTDINISDDDTIIAVCNQNKEGDYIQDWDYIFQITDQSSKEKDLVDFDLILESLSDPDIENI